MLFETMHFKELKLKPELIKLLMFQSLIYIYYGCAD